MRCDEAKDLLDNPQSAEEQETGSDVGEHVDACSSCQDFNEDLEIIEQAMSSIPEERISQQASVRIHNSIAMMIAEKERERSRAIAATQEEVLPTFWERVRTLFTVPMMAQAGAACAVMAFAFYTYNFTTDVEQMPQQVAKVETPAATMPVKTAPAAVETMKVQLLEGKMMVAGLLITNDAKEPLEVPVPKGQAMTTAPGHEARFELASGVRVHLDPSTRVTLGKDSIQLQKGRTGIHVPKGAPKGFTVQTAHTEAVILGTRVMVEDHGQVDLLEGTVRVSSKQSGIAVQPEPGQSIAFDAKSGSLVVDSTGEFRMNFLYRVFTELDTPAEVAKDVGTTPAALEQALADGKALPKKPVQKPVAGALMAQVDLGEIPVAVLPEPVATTEIPVPTGTAPAGIKIDILGTQSND